MIESTSRIPAYWCSLSQDLKTLVSDRVNFAYSSVPVSIFCDLLWQKGNKVSLWSFWVIVPSTIAIKDLFFFLHLSSGLVAIDCLFLTCSDKRLTKCHFGHSEWLKPSKSAIKILVFFYINFKTVHNAEVIDRLLFIKAQSTVKITSGRSEVMAS